MLKVSKLGGLLREILANSGPSDKHPVQQVKDMVYLQCNGSLAPDQYHMYDLHKKSVTSLRGLPYMGSRCYRDLDALLNDPLWRSLEQNKWYFYLHFKKLGFPVPEVYGVIGSQVGITVEGLRSRIGEELLELINKHSLDELVIKPVDGGQGKGVLVLKRHNSDVFADLSGTVYTIQQLTEHMGSQSFLVQQRVRQHRFMEDIAPFALNCFRIVTFRDVHDQYHVHAAYLRFGRKGSNTDNRSGGGIGVFVDLATGELGTGRSKVSKERYSCHPDTDVQFSGLVVPLWEETVALVLRAASVFPLGSVGWDIALTPDGPKLIECNTHWEFKLSQQVYGGYLQPQVRAQLAERGINQF